MKCPNCGMSMSKGYCMHCGYMDNGVIIDTKKVQQASLVECYFGKEYDKFFRNENWLISGILGPTYLFCHGFYLKGFLLILIDSFISLFCLIFNHVWMLSAMIAYMNKIYWIVNRLLWSAIGNMIYLKWMEKKLKVLQDKNPDNYRELIVDKYQKDRRFVILKYICFGLLFLFLFVFIQNMVYYYLQLS